MNPPCARILPFYFGLFAFCRASQHISNTMKPSCFFGLALDDPLMTRQAPTHKHEQFSWLCWLRAATNIGLARLSRTLLFEYFHPIVKQREASEHIMTLFSIVYGLTITS